MRASKGKRVGDSRATRIAAAALAGALAGSLIACRPAGQSRAKRYDFKGKVVSVDKKGRQAVIEHEAIPGLMEAMTMPFTVKEDWVLDTLAAGDSVQGALVMEGSSSWLEDLVISRQSPDETSPEGPSSSSEPALGTEVPDLPLVNQDGERISLGRFRGRRLALTFIYTRCPLPDYCPLMTERFGRVLEAINADPSLGDGARLLSITVDPEYDTPKVLREYGAEQTGGVFRRWEFATGTAAEVKAAASFFGLAYWPEGDQIIHSLRTAVIRPDGTLYKLYHGSDWTPEQIIGDLKAAGKLD